MTWTEREGLHQRALTALVRASAELLRPSAEGKAAAMLYAAQAIAHLAASDPERRARDYALEAIERLQAQRAAGEPA